MLGFIGKIFKVVAHPVTAIVVRSFDEAIALVESFVTGYADKKLTPDEKREIAGKLHALAKSILGI